MSAALSWHLIWAAQLPLHFSIQHLDSYWAFGRGSPCFILAEFSAVFGMRRGFISFMIHRISIQELIQPKGSTSKNLWVDLCTRRMYVFFSFLSSFTISNVFFSFFSKKHRGNRYFNQVRFGWIYAVNSEAFGDSLQCKFNLCFDSNYEWFELKL